jgi:competence protein ComEA
MSSVKSRWLMVAVGVLSVALTAGLAHAAPAATAQSTAPPAKAAPHSGHKLDINTASAADLAKLPGIGDAYSQKIIAGRPYKGKDELLHKKILPKSVYDKIEHMIIAKQG